MNVVFSKNNKISVVYQIEIAIIYLFLKIDCFQSFLVINLLGLLLYDQFILHPDYFYMQCLLILKIF